MVSRGGRSLGCRQCRRRRVKCDETRPACNNCKKRGLDCTGPKEKTWIIQQAPPPKKSENQLVLSPSSITPTISPVAFRENIYLCYIRKKLFSGGPVAFACEMVYPDTLEVARPIENPPREVLRKAIMSLAISFFGSQHRQIEIQNDGYRLYGSALSELNVILAQPKLQVADETILSVFACLLLEVFVPTGKNNYLSHIRGLESILELRGPINPDTNRMAFVLARAMRVASIFGGLALSRPSIYARDEWKRVPCAEFGEDDILRHRLFDVMADLTQLLSEHKEMVSSGTNEGHEPALQKAKALVGRLRTLRDLWESFNSGAQETQGTAIPSGTTSKRRLKIANHVSATLLLLYNTTMIFLTQLLRSLDPSIDYQSLQRTAALQIVECFESKKFEKREGSAYSNTVGHAAARVAWGCLGGFNSPEGRRLSRFVKGAVGDVFAIGAWADMAWETIPNCGQNGPWLGG
ncbi:hypothetical protein BCR34DRAFT_591957 [Clohesyomyces aquaticus]|uniref:Zn(2)-C6 fungal-type domain-containing protein n=1 Tax=Clohesyomyces aquaticus TaxID=1231657 RepID=A0A1Y1YXI1_9PLEO|nr:hypothetical protein BCR34DRAFT_591957 [Clohesyomyces aquaticus]